MNLTDGKKGKCACATPEELAWVKGQRVGRNGGWRGGSTEAAEERARCRESAGAGGRGPGPRAGPGSVPADVQRLRDQEQAAAPCHVPALEAAAAEGAGGLVGWLASDWGGWVEMREAAEPGAPWPPAGLEGSAGKGLSREESPGVGHG